jgi:hypothetical protein
MRPARPPAAAAIACGGRNMASTIKDGTAAAAQQLGSISLGKSVERKENDTEPTAKNGTNPAKKLCSACGKKSNTLKKCNGCKCVWYCDKDCQNKHRKEHKKECKLIKKELDKRRGKLDLGTELDVGPLGKVPPREECPICMRMLPLHERLHTYFACCGKTICRGCDYQHQKKSGKHPMCAFCRSPVPRSDEELLARLRKRVELKDPHALVNLAVKYEFGRDGLSADQAKCIELLRQSAALGFPAAHFQLANYHHNGKMGLKQDEKEALKYLEKAAEGGDLDARHNLGFIESRNDNHVAAINHWRMSASGGYKQSMGGLIVYFELAFFHHGDLAETLQSMYCARAEMKSEDRDQYIKYLKHTGEYRYEKEYDL